MAMTSYEVIKRALHFGTPERLPFSPDDIHEITPHFYSSEWSDYSLREVSDPWGCVWLRTEVKNMGHPKGHPLADWDAIKTYSWPDPDNPAYYDGLEEQFAGSEDKYVRVGIGLTLWERMWFLRGMDNVLVELYTDRARMEYLADRIVEYTVQVIHNLGARFPGRIHGVLHTDDWGTQLATFINPRMWCDFFQPRYARIFEADHAQGWDTWEHSDGRINDIVGPWKDAGLDAINMPAPLMVGIDEISERYQGKICFFGSVDNQQTLPFGTAEEIRAQARLLLERWATPQGGFVCSAGIRPAREDIYEVYDMTPWAARVAYEAFQEFDPYQGRA
jgi:uroporphyrinogen decarboxylase